MVQIVTGNLVEVSSAVRIEIFNGVKAIHAYIFLSIRIIFKEHENLDNNHEKTLKMGILRLFRNEWDNKKWPTFRIRLHR
jgi:hypothetical protein